MLESKIRSVRIVLQGAERCKPALFGGAFHDGSNTLLSAFHAHFDLNFKQKNIKCNCTAPCALWAALPAGAAAAVAARSSPVEWRLSFLFNYCLLKQGRLRFPGVSLVYGNLYAGAAFGAAHLSRTRGAWANQECPGGVLQKV